MSSFDRRNDCDGSSRDEETFRSVNSFPTIIGDPVRSFNYYSTILRTILGEFNIWSRQPLRVCVSRSTRFVSRNYTGFVVSNSTVFSKYIFSKCQYYAPRQRCFSTIKSTCTWYVFANDHSKRSVRQPKSNVSLKSLLEILRGNDPRTLKRSPFSP